MFFFFFFQAEDGIRDTSVTGVQTCALPISRLRLIFTDGVFSMEGDIAKLPDIVALARQYEAVVAVDDSHATGVLGRTGRGTAEHYSMVGQVDIITSTLGKALGGAAGGFTAGPAAFA